MIRATAKSRMRSSGVCAGKTAHPWRASCAPISVAKTERLRSSSSAVRGVLAPAWGTSRTSRTSPAPCAAHTTRVPSRSQSRARPSRARSPPGSSGSSAATDAAPSVTVS